MLGIAKTSLTLLSLYRDFRYRNQRSWLARCYVAEGGGNNKERDVTFLLYELTSKQVNGKEA